MQNIRDLPYLLFYVSLLIIFGCKENKESNFPPGGYSFPAVVNPNDSNEFFYVLKDTLSTKDSLLSYQQHHFFKAFNEENLSQKPYKEEIIRFVHQQFMSPDYVIRLTKEKLVVKKSISGRIYPEDDLNRLVPIERIHYTFLNQYFPLNEIDKSTRKGHYVDSMIKLDPKLLNIAYYDYLWAKAKVPITEPFRYDSKEFKISESDYIRIVNLINHSGYWTSKPFLKCSEAMADGYGFRLEVNTTKKYNIVFVGGCPDDSSGLIKACQAIADLAGLSKDIRLLWSSHEASADSIEVKSIQVAPVHR